MTAPGSLGPATRPRSLHGSVAACLLLAVVVAASLLDVHLIDRYMAPEKADMVPIWVAERAAFAGNNPYSAATTLQIQTAYYGRPLRASDHVNKMTFAYPAHTLVIFAALAPFTWPTLRIVFAILLPALTALSALLWIRVVGIALNRQRLVLVALLAVFSGPAMWGIRLAQPTLVVAALVAAGCFFLSRSRGSVAGFLLALSTIKPQLVGPLLAWLCVWAVLRRRWNFLLSFAFSLASLVLSASWLVPGWIGKWRAAIADFLAYRHLKLDLTWLVGGPLGLLLTAMLVMAAVAALWRALHCDPRSPSFGAMCSLALAAALASQPTDLTMRYNNILLLPACLILVFRVPVSTLAGYVRGFAIVLLVLAMVPVSDLGQLILPRVSFFTVLPFLDYLLPPLIVLMLAAEGLRSAAPVTVSQSQRAVEPARS